MNGARVRLTVALYGGLAGVAFVWGALRNDWNLYHVPAVLRLPFPLSTLLAAALGLGVAVAVIAGTRVLVRHTEWARALHLEFRDRFGAMTGGEIAVLALTGSIAEELLFRGAALPALGLWGSSLLFGFLHVGPSKRFLPWTLWAVAMGFVFGVLYMATGELLAPMIAHILINHENMHFIVAYDPRRHARDLASSS